MTTKEICRVNLFPNARCVATGKHESYTVNSSVEFGVVSSGLEWVRCSPVTLDRENSAAYFGDLRTIPGSEYVFRAKIHASSKVQIRIFDNGSQTKLVDINIPAMGSTYYEARFTALSDDTTVRFEVPLVDGGYTMFTQPQLELASTYDAAVSGGGLRFFAWDTMPRQ